MACEVYFAKIETHLKGTSEDTRHLTRLLEMADVRKMARWTMGGMRTPVLLSAVAFSMQLAEASQSLAPALKSLGLVLLLAAFSSPV